MLSEYFELCKPRVVALMILTAVVGMHLATSSWVPLPVLFFGTLGIALTASSAAAINHTIDRHIDTLMHRTQTRPVASGKIRPRQAIQFAVVIGVIGLSILVFTVNAMTALLSGLTLIGYAGVYTLYLKRATPQNIVIGGLAGATPPLLGWVAVTGHVDAYSLLPVGIIFAWTPPHFWALAVHRYEEYKNAEIPMLPVTHGIPFTKLCMVLYTILLILVSILPTLTGMSGYIYGVSALGLGGWFLVWILRLYFDAENRCAMQCFRHSITYLGFLFLMMCVDHYLR
jgi:heme o synthase